MIIGEVRAKIAWAGRHCGYPVAHLDPGGATADHPKGNGSIMTTEAELRSSSGLTDGSFRRRTGVRSIGRLRHRMIPQREVPSPAMWSMAESANLGFCGRPNSAWAGRGQIVLGGKDGVGERLAPKEQDDEKE